ncbi:MAG: mechanosensitive ion channel family protein, partial [bacterium]
LEERIELARKLKTIYDSRGLYVNVDILPDTSIYIDSLTGLPEVILHKQLPQIFLRKVGDRWLFARESVEAVPALYRQTVSAFVEYTIDRMPSFLKAKFMNIALWQIIGIFVVLLLGFLIRKLSEYFLSRIALRLTQKTKTKWDEKIIEVSIKPISLFLMASWFLLAYPNLQFNVIINSVLRVASLVLIYLSIIWLLYRFIDLLEVYLTSITSKTESKLDDQLVPLIRKSLKIFLIIIGTIFVLQNLDINVTSLLTGLGLGGLAFALAARDTLANLFGSVTIFLDKPFQVGDWVIIGSVEGTVEEVGFRSTRIRTFYNSVVSIPNAKVADSAIDNMGLRQYRRIKTVLGLTYSTTAEQMHAFVEGIRAIIQANAYTRKDFFEIHFNNFADFSLNVLIYVFVKVETWSDELRERHNIFLEILRLADEIGVEFAFPTQTVHVDSFFGDKPREIGKQLADEKLAKTVQDFGPKGSKSHPGGPVLTYNGKPLDFSATASKVGDDAGE